MSTTRTLADISGTGDAEISFRSIWFRYSVRWPVFGLQRAVSMAGSHGLNIRTIVGQICIVDIRPLKILQHSALGRASDGECRADIQPSLASGENAEDENDGQRVVRAPSSDTASGLSDSSQPHGSSPLPRVPPSAFVL